MEERSISFDSNEKIREKYSAWKEDITFDSNEKIREKYSAWKEDITFDSNEKIREKYSAWKEEASVLIPMKNQSGQNILHGKKKHQF
jgi:phage terminase large subunit-like protein